MGLTQQQFGELVGISATFVSGIERGRASIPPQRYKIFAQLRAVLAPYTPH
jgi:transcriptional regulator with XRE-family HTH domain